MNIKRNIIFALESRKKNGVPIVENVPIRMRVIYASQRIEFTTGYRIDVAKWDADKQRVKNGFDAGRIFVRAGIHANHHARAHRADADTGTHPDADASSGVLRTLRTLRTFRTLRAFGAIRTGCIVRAGSARYL